MVCKKYFSGVNELDEEGNYHSQVAEFVIILKKKFTLCAMYMMYDANIRPPQVYIL